MQHRALGSTARAGAALVMVEVEDERDADVRVQREQVLQRVAVGYVIVLHARAAHGRLQRQPVKCSSCNTETCP